jgi:predicted ATP-grasp superfamily ATP-dependent carboligase
MAGLAPDEVTRDAAETAGGRAGCDILILDAMNKQSLASARRLGRTGLRVALGESVGQYRPSSPPPSFASRYCARSVTLPDYTTDTASYVAEVVSFARDHRVKVVLPTGDESIAALAPHRERFAELGCVLAVASDAALEIATDKARTLEVAAKLGIDYPRSVEVVGVAELRRAEAEFGYPFVVKPTMSWTGKTGVRVAPVEVIDEAEALDATTRFLATGAGVLAQQLASGRREGVSLFIADGEVLAHCGHVAHRTSPALGGASVMRESIEVPAEVLDAAVRLAIAIGVEGACEVEFRRDASDRPLLMEINPRLAGTLENAIRSGVDFPLMTWQWATGGPVQPVRAYRAGVRTRWLRGDLRWLVENQRRIGRPDSVPSAQAVWTFLSEFTRTRYYDYFDRDDVRPGLAEMRNTAAAVRRSRH